VNRIILDPKPQRTQLPVYTEIDQEQIRDAAGAWDAAKTALDEAKKAHAQAEMELPASEWRDAEIVAEARAAGKPEPTKRAHTSKHEQRIGDLAHELKVATLTEQRTFDGLQAALDEHQEEWAESIECDVQSLNDEWADAINTLVEIHARRSAALAIKAMVVGGEQPGVGALGFKSGQIRGIDFAQGAGRQTGYVPTGDVLAGLADLGMPEPVVETAPVEHAPPVRPGGSPLTRDHADVRRELDERDGLAEPASAGG
jgi:hypothetical protein